MNNFYKYETLKGDTFDIISLDFYNDEKFASEIIQANPQYRDTLVFDAGIKLDIPIISKKVMSSLPWRRWYGDVL